jgi:hypothetical protein
MDIDQPLDYDFTEGKAKTELNLYIPPEFEDITILTDLLSYVLPAGMSCNIIKELHIKTVSNTNIGLADTVTWKSINSNAYSQIPRITTGSTTDPTTIKTSDAIKALITGSKPGFSVNSEIVKLEG